MSNFLNDIFKKPSLLLASLALCMNMASYSQDKVIKPSLSGIVVDKYRQQTPIASAMRQEVKMIFYNGALAKNTGISTIM